jgi:hypothetical protein
MAQDLLVRVNMILKLSFPFFPCVYMYVHRVMIPVETIPGMDRERDKEQ